MLRRERPRRDVAVIRRHVVIDNPRDGVADARRGAAGGRGLGDRAFARGGGERLQAVIRRRAVI